MNAFDEADDLAAYDELYGPQAREARLQMQLNLAHQMPGLVHAEPGNRPAGHDGPDRMRERRRYAAILDVNPAIAGRNAFEQADRLEQLIRRLEQAR